jgi:hypothetical protein
MVSDTTAGSVYYYDDIWVYTRISSNTILNATFDRLRPGLFKSGDDGLNMRPGMYAQNSKIIQPEPADPFYLGNGDQLLEVSAREWLFDTTGSDTLQEYKIGEDYVFELSFYYKGAGDGLTNTPSLLFLYNGWMLHTFANTDWYGGIWVCDENGPLINIKPTPDKWHRYIVKYRFETVSKITYSFYYDDAKTPLVTVTLDAAVPGEMDNHFDNLISTFGFVVGGEGFSMTEYPLYLNDVLLYRGDIRPWPSKYTGETIDIMYGDVDGDGKVTAFDATLVLQHVVKMITLEGRALKAADTDHDGSITTFDATLILQYVVGMISSLD